MSRKLKAIKIGFFGRHIFWFLNIYICRTGSLVHSVFLDEEGLEKGELAKSYLVHDCCFSVDGTKFAVILDNKILRVFECNDWSVVFEKVLVKRATSVALSHKGDEVCIADKFGDAYR